MQAGASAIGAGTTGGRVREQKDKFIVAEWAREEWGLWMLFGNEHRCILPLKDAERGRLVELACELNAAWNDSRGTWISVENRLPEPFEWVLLKCQFAGDGEDAIVTGRKGNTAPALERTWWEMLRGQLITNVTHWMPLPDPPITICGHPVKVSEDVPEGIIAVSNGEGTIIVTDGRYRVEITNIEGETHE